ncbi:MAG: hypothetical protein ACRDT1_15965, partial [Micromonosporaceae bacterium]
GVFAFPDITHAAGGDTLLQPVPTAHHTAGREHQAPFPHLTSSRKLSSPAALPVPGADKTVISAVAPEGRSWHTSRQLPIGVYG